jgi:hypothetical protein
MQEFVHLHSDAHGGAVWSLAIELLLWAGLTLIAVLIVFRGSGPLRDIEPTEEGVRPHALFSPEAWKCAAAGLLMLPVVWLVARYEAKGQALGAAFTGGMAVGLVGRIVSPHVQPIVLFVSPLIIGAVGYVVALMMLDGTLLATFTSGDFPPLLNVAPVDYAAATPMGVAVGLGWAKSFLHHEEDEKTTAAAATTTV